MFGGILLYEKSIPEDVNQLYAQSDNVLIGYSSNNVNDKTDTMRGSMNQTESGPLEDGTGYRFVFDFATSQANGTISSLGLTSKWGGIAGNGGIEWNNVQCPAVYMESYTYGVSYTGNLYGILTIVHYDQDTGIGTAVYVSGQNSITVQRFRLHAKKWRLLGKMRPFDDTQIIDTQYIQTEVFAGSVSGKVMYHTFCDGGDGYIWGFEHSGGVKGNSSGNASVNWIKIKVDDLSVEEGTWDINAQLYFFGIRTDPTIGSGNGNGNASNVVNAAILDGYLYCVNYQKTGVYKINIKNVTNVMFIEHPYKKVYCDWSNSTYGYNEKLPVYCLGSLTVFGNRVCMWNGWINGDKIQPNKVSSGITRIDNQYLRDGWVDSSPDFYPYRNLFGMYSLKMGALALGFSCAPHEHGMVATILLDSTYLATINNLATPVEKTADKTMKITYILREETV